VDQGDPRGAVLEPLLSREAAGRRVKLMGEGVTVGSHEVRDGALGSRESVTVYQVADLSKFRYISPFVGYNGYTSQQLVFDIRPTLTGRGWYYCGVGPGSLIVSARARKYPDAGGKSKGKKGASQGKGGKDARGAGGYTPLEVQTLRELVPVFGDMLEDFKVKVTLETYCPISAGGGYVTRTARTRSRHMYLIDVSGKDDMDKYGYPFVKNEEIMVDMLRGKLSRKGRFWSSGLYNKIGRGYDYRPATSLMVGNGTMPLINQTRGIEIGFPASRALFKRYLEGKQLDYTTNPHTRHLGKVMADFAKVGWKGERKTVAKDFGDQCEPGCPWCKPKATKKR
jgi:hypothetical protein